MLVNIFSHLANSPSNIKTGIFTVLGVGLILLFIYFIGNNKNLFRKTIQFKINYKTVSGLQEGNFVRVGGINAGAVEHIQMMNDTNVMVSISVRKNIATFIKKNSKASISNDGSMGDKLIQIAPGTDASPIAQNNDFLMAVDPFDMDKVMTRVEKAGIKIESIVNNIDTLSGILSSIFTKINNGKGAIGKLLNSEKFSNEIENTIHSTQKTVNSINSAATGLKENMEAAKHNFLLKGYFRKKEKKRIQDSTAHATKKGNIKCARKVHFLKTLLRN